MARLLTGIEAARAKREELQKRIERLRAQGTVPTVGLIRVGEKPDDIQYETAAAKLFERLGIRLEKRVFAEDVEAKRLLLEIERMNRDETVHGIMMFRPLPRRLNEEALVNAIAPHKDIDGMTNASLAGVFLNSGTGFAPCTAEACMELLDYYGIDPRGKRAVVVGRSQVIGRPVAMMLMHQNATVTICHSQTAELWKLCREADILVAAVGKARMIDASCIGNGATVIDVGINVMPDGSVVGDVDFDSVFPVAEAISPVPRGVGSLTTTILAAHIVKAAEERNE
ncbi:MAG: tetrahydrofolate dehydrogenase/cyclohydrolase catalytic domain-containing protein [Clostridia bacterium]|nr:tetrahydrofolate dehydrogenase/cyclohydrolase catalytic domain-containing protein [Clostridia bacterium]